MCAKHVTTLSFGRPAQSVAVLACPLSPAAGLLREPHLVPVQLIRQVASSLGDAVHHLASSLGDAVHHPSH
jgi:hypothetical protein